MNLTAIMGMLLSLLVLPALTFGFIILLRKTKAEVEVMKYKKEMLELEVEREELHYRSLVEENRKYDRLIDAGGKPQA